MEVFNAVRAHLQTIGATTLQLVPPGGQAFISVTFKQDEQRRTCFPDLIAWSNRTLFLGELKPKFSEQDRLKVIDILELGVDPLIRRCERALGSGEIDEVRGLLCHAQAGVAPAQGVMQWIFGSDLQLRETIQPA
jgi:hypothetical protein